MWRTGPVLYENPLLRSYLSRQMDLASLRRIDLDRKLRSSGETAQDRLERPARKVKTMGRFRQRRTRKLQIVAASAMGSLILLWVENW
jgi:hypothetical protein